MKNFNQSKSAVKLWIPRIITFAVVCFLAAIFWNSAHAQSSDWVDPATDIIDNVATGLQVIGGGLIGIAVCVVGIMMMTSGRINWMWIISILFGGVLIFLGGTIIGPLLGISI